MSNRQFLPKIKIINGKTYNNSPHLVILGAGASIACMQKTSNNKKLPSMNDLFSLDEISKIITKHSLGIIKNESFEEFFSRISSNKSKGDAVKDLEECIYDYFSNMEIDETPNLYDKLILSLRGKDVIATFNWDPLLLLLSYTRHKIIGDNNLPTLLFLHGNVGEGRCYDCKVLCNYYNKFCHRCEKKLSKSKLLYPVGKKDYTSDLVIRQHWEKLKDIMSKAYIITIFGYSAPNSDIEAKNIFIDTYKSSFHLEQSEIEIINIEDKDKIEKTWENLFFSHHYAIFEKLEHSYILQHPRRSCDDLASALLQCDPVEENNFPNLKTIKEMHNFIKPLIKEEWDLNLI